MLSLVFLHPWEGQGQRLVHLMAVHGSLSPRLGQSCCWPDAKV